jgi:hypothetical protein
MSNIGDSNLIKIARRAIASGTRIEAQHVNEALRTTGEWYIANYRGDNSFVKGLQRWATPSAAQIAAALRVAVDELRPAIAALVAEESKAAGFAVPSAPADDAAAAQPSAGGWSIDLRSSKTKAREDAGDAIADATSAEIVRTIPNGYYTVIVTPPDAETRHYTIRIADVPAKFDNVKPGTQIAEMLTGSDNTGDYTGFAFVRGTRPAIWSKYRAYDGWRAALAALVDNFERAASRYVLQSGRCFICNRPLTTPDSIAAGIGPICAAKVRASGISFTGSTLRDEIAAADRMAAADIEADQRNAAPAVPGTAEIA